ncbi:MAG: hypothetical protein ACYDCJ_03925 [Gammaproteobacteria bacterium]
MYRFKGDVITSLLNKPEYGMGYQRGRATLSSGEVLAGFVFNAELFVPDEERTLYKTVASRVMFAKALTEAKTADPYIRSIEVIPRYASKSRAVMYEVAKTIIEETKGAAGSPADVTAAAEVFKRFTAYANDRRVTANHGLVPGTYATTARDAGLVRTGREAVARYALPNPAPAIYVFTIKPPKDTKIQRGTVQPANSQPGGGAEVLFTDGTADRTVTGPETIPEG